MTNKITLTIACDSLLDAAAVEEFIENNLPGAKVGIAVGGGEPVAVRKRRKVASGKLGPARVREIHRSRHRLTCTEASREFNVSPSTVSRIFRGLHPLVSANGSGSPLIS